MAKCQCLTQKGTQCQNEGSNKPQHNSTFCWRHQNCEKIAPLTQIEKITLKKKTPPLLKIPLKTKVLNSALTPKSPPSTKTNEPIKFYSPDQPYYEFSNFYGTKNSKDYKLYIDGQYWPSTEHYYQANKFMGKNATQDSIEYAQLIATADTPNKAYILAKQKLVGGYASKWNHSKKIQKTLNELIKLSHAKGIKMRSDWDQVKDEVMIRANQAKYQQNPKLKQLLISTGNSQLIEHTKRDKYWGDGGDGSGLNKLGQILMQIRYAYMT